MQIAFAGCDDRGSFDHSRANSIADFYVVVSARTEIAQRGNTGAQGLLRACDGREQTLLLVFHDEDRQRLRLAVHFQMRVRVDEARDDRRRFAIGLRTVAGGLDSSNFRLIDRHDDVRPRRVQRAVVEFPGLNSHRRLRSRLR